jgi:hypothetical protein
MDVRRISADLPAAIPLPGLCLAEPLALVVADHERRVREHESLTVSSCDIRPADRLLDAACPASIQDPAALVDYRHASLIGQKAVIAFSPGKVNTQEASICHPAVISHSLVYRYAAHRVLARIV